MGPPDMDFSTLLRVAARLLTSGRKDDLRKRFPELDVSRLYDEDPSGNGKYLEWILKQVQAGVGEDEALASVKGFHAALQRMEEKDIRSYETVEALQEAVDSAGPSKRREKAESKAGAVKVLEDETTLLVRLDTHAAAMEYGRDTRWCISMDDPKWWSDYSHTIIYALIQKGVNPRVNPRARMALQFVFDPDLERIVASATDAADRKMKLSECGAPQAFLDAARNDAEGRLETE